jgi:enterochelin esterase-like enzyme
MGLRTLALGLGVMLQAMPPTAAAEPLLPQVSVGRIERLELPSRHVDTRPVDVWLPPGYAPGQPHAVVYAHDGQMLFDAKRTWNGQAWNIHFAVAQLMAAGRIPPTIVVGIWNAGPLRHSEYYPAKFLPYLPEATRTRFVAERLAGRPRSDAYLRFLVEELKPEIDRRYATRADAAGTVILGASMGGLISVYALNEYPQVFGAAAGLSTHWVGLREPNHALPLAAFEYLRDHLLPPDRPPVQPPEGRRLYMDHGTTELDAIYAPYQAFVDEILRDRGYGASHYWSRVLPGTGHNETVWAARVGEVIEFLFTGRRPPAAR